MFVPRKQFLDAFMEGAFPNFMEEPLETLKQMMEGNRKSTFRLVITIQPYGAKHGNESEPEAG
jgi:hypothetical protein